MNHNHKITWITLTSFIITSRITKHTSQYPFHKKNISISSDHRPSHPPTGVDRHVAALLVITPRPAAPTVHPFACWGRRCRGSREDQRHPPSVLLPDGVGRRRRRGPRQGQMRSSPLCVPHTHSKKWRPARSLQLQAWAGHHRRAPASSRSESSTPGLVVPVTPTAHLPTCWGQPHHRADRASTCRLG
jgi:hypothetical protein